MALDEKEVQTGPARLREYCDISPLFIVGLLFKSRTMGVGTCCGVLLY